MGRSILEAERWSSLMGAELELASLQPLQVVKIKRTKVVAISPKSLRVLGLSGGGKLLLALRDGTCVLRRNSRSGMAVGKGKAARLPVSSRIEKALSAPEADALVLVGGEGEATILPVRVQERGFDVMGPRFIDELRDDCVVRHAIPGPGHDEWTDERLGELEELVCSEPFPVDPVAAIADGGDWVGWMTRNRILQRPSRGDHAFRKCLVNSLFARQQANGSWGSVPATGYAVLQALTLGVRPSDGRLKRAAAWLLDLPEPPGRPGMWMLTPEHLDEWTTKWKPAEACESTPRHLVWSGPGRGSFYARDAIDSEQDHFRSPEDQQVIPPCKRDGAAACEPRLTQVSALAAEALLRCGYADHPRLRRYCGSAFRVGGVDGYWCGCGALGFTDPDIPPWEEEPDFEAPMGGNGELPHASAWRWLEGASQSALLANEPGTRKHPRPEIQGTGTSLEPFRWHRVPGHPNRFTVLGTAWQNGDCWAKVNRALSQHPSCSGSLTEKRALYQASRYQTSLGEWHQAYAAGMLALLSQYDHPFAHALVAKTIPWLRAHQAEDGLWHQEELPRRKGSGQPPEPRLATYHVLAALRNFGLLDQLRA